MPSGPSSKNGRSRAVSEPGRIDRGSGNVFADLGLPDPDLAVAKAELVQRIRAGTPHYRNPARKLTNIARDIGGASRIIRFPGDVHHRNRSFGRDAGHLPPDVFVQHQVADNENTLVGCLVENLLQTSTVHLIEKLLGEPDLCEANFCLELLH